MFSTKNLAQNESITLAGSRHRSVVAALATIAATSATAVFVVEIPVTPVGVGAITEWIAVGLVDGVAQAPVSNLTGPSGYCWANTPGAEVVRVRRTDASGGNGTVGFSLVEG